MEKITIEVEWNLPRMEKKKEVFEVIKGTTVAKFLESQPLTIDLNEVMVVYNGKAAVLTDGISETGKIILLPVLCGG
ncbi:MAG: hypothetical protein ACOY3J_09525 [Bacillota bacterium]|uniref:MoaD/ThiS family protein n=1 Tax=Thermanaerosceptrum fracticalcis TaxID=1712410 RepID=A0A7G6DZD6_THEFR|nr:hypothetical protein [Thermanaerosceptrum fracticalcis]QNB45190.1 hypothetical protein BR63_01950 [Thermanaerosceptrum fracticalcis]